MGVGVGVGGCVWGCVEVKGRVINTTTETREATVRCCMFAHSVYVTTGHV